MYLDNLGHPVVLSRPEDRQNLGFLDILEHLEGLFLLVDLVLPGDQ